MIWALRVASSAHCLLSLFQHADFNDLVRPGGHVNESDLPLSIGLVEAQRNLEVRAAGLRFHVLRQVFNRLAVRPGHLQVDDVLVLLPF